MATIRKWFGFRYLWCSQILPLKHYALLSASRKMLKTALNFVSRSSIVFLRQFCGFLSGEEGLILRELLPSDKYNNSDKFLDCTVFHHLSKNKRRKGKEERKERTNIKTAYSYKVEIKLYNSSFFVSSRRFPGFV